MKSARTFSGHKSVHKAAVALILLALVPGFTPQARAEASNQQLTIGVSQEFENLNPIIAQMSATFYLYQMAARRLDTINADWKWECELCVSIPSIENKLAKFVTEGGQKKIVAQWEIKKEAVWGDGAPITGNDVKASWEIGTSTNVAVGDKEVWNQVESITVDAANPKKFTMKYNMDRYDFYQMVNFYIVPKHVESAIFEQAKNTQGAYEKQTAYSTNPTNPALYSGPYLVKEIKLGSHVILEKNPKWWGTPAKIQKIIVKYIPNTQTLEANLLSGTIDMIGEVGVSLDQALSLEKRSKADATLAAKMNVQFRDGMIYEHIDLNLRNPILADVNVRRALLYGIDREKLVQGLFEGKEKVALHNISPMDPYYTAEVWKYKYDPEMAARILDNAGWKAGADGIRAKDGQKLSLVFMTTAENKTRELVQVYIQSEWKKIGVDVKIKNEPARVYFGETVRKGQYPALAMFAWSSSPDLPPRSMLHTSSIPSDKNGFSGQNSGGFSDVEVDKSLDKIRTEFSFNKRKELMKVVQQEYTKEVPVIPLYLRSEIAVVPSKLKGFRITGHQFMSSQSVEHWDLN